MREPAAEEAVAPRHRDTRLRPVRRARTPRGSLRASSGDTRSSASRHSTQSCARLRHRELLLRRRSPRHALLDHARAASGARFLRYHRGCPNRRRRVSAANGADARHSASSRAASRVITTERQGKRFGHASGVAPESPCGTAWSARILRGFATGATSAGCRIDARRHRMPRSVSDRACSSCGRRRSATSSTRSRSSPTSRAHRPEHRDRLGRRGRLRAARRALTAASAASSRSRCAAGAARRSRARRGARSARSARDCARRATTRPRPAGAGQGRADRARRARPCATASTARASASRSPRSSHDVHHRVAARPAFHRRAAGSSPPRALGYALDGPPRWHLRAAGADAGDARRARTSSLLHATSRADKLWPEAHWRALIAHFAQRRLRDRAAVGQRRRRSARSRRLAEGIADALVPPRLVAAGRRGAAGARRARRRRRHRPRASRRGARHADGRALHRDRPARSPASRCAGRTARDLGGVGVVPSPRRRDRRRRRRCCARRRAADRDARALYTLLWWLRAAAAAAAPVVARPPRARLSRARRRALRPLRAALRARPRVLWMHAVSLGETRAAAPLIERLLRERPRAAILLTHMTATGRDSRARAVRRSRRCRRGCRTTCRSPCARFLAHFRPRCRDCCMETELWPNLVAQRARARRPAVSWSTRGCPSARRAATRASRALTRPMLARARRRRRAVARPTRRACARSARATPSSPATSSSTSTCRRARRRSARELRARFGADAAGAGRGVDARRRGSAARSMRSRARRCRRRR